VTATTIVELPVFIDVHDVMRSMKCSRTMAYGHMRKALGRAPGERGQLRVPVYVWLRYVQRRFDREHERPQPGRRASSVKEVTAATAIPITRPRTKPRADVPRPEGGG